MAYRQDLKSAARRYLRAGQELYKVETLGAAPACRAVAGYVFGIAGENAVKEVMRASGIRQLPKQQEGSDPFFAHFPKLKTLLLDHLSGRRADELRRFTQDSRQFQYWDIEMRYAPTDDIKSEWVTSWKQSAEDLVKMMDKA